MAQPREYKRTLFDRHGAAAGDLLRVTGYGLMICVVVCAALTLKLGLHAWIFGVGLGAGATVAAMVLLFVGAAGTGWKRVMMGGSTTPYREQFSYQQSLVMRGKLDEALESFEAVISEQPQAVDARIKAAELYANEKRNYQRALERAGARARQSISTLRSRLISERCFFSERRFSFAARVGFVGRRFLGMWSACFTRAASRASAAARF